VRHPHASENQARKSDARASIPRQNPCSSATRAGTVRAALTVAAALLCSSCASLRAPPPRFESPVAGSAAVIVDAAAGLVGRPYHFGGADAAGFDCSGLALYVHERAGLTIPRTAAAQQQAAHPVPLASLAPGDLVFFRMHAHGIDHVGIYAGDGRFIHAPRAGLKVSYADLRSGYYAHHLVSAGRFW
jgi:cell wall-associated NlpC family hydrolase